VAFFVIEVTFKRQITSFHVILLVYFERERGGDIMTAKKDLIIAVLATFCLTATLFVVIPIGGLPVYDPWKDLNDDGVIDGQDFQMVKGSIPSLGEPINKTALLYNVNDTFTALLSRIDSLNASLLELQSRVEALETGYVGRPAYDSGWVTVNAGNYLTLTHNLNTTEVFVYVVGRLGPPDDHIIHHLHYGGWGYYLYDGTGHVYASREEGLTWTGLTNTTIGLVRSSGDTDWQQVRVMIWKIPQ